MIFPRYHQLDVVRKLADHARQHRSGHNYLIQHSAGSGKSNSIARLAHRLATLHDRENEKIFHSVVVITDRVVLDQQLQDTIFQFEHKQGVVQKIDENTQQLARALADGVPIIIRMKFFRVQWRSNCTSIPAIAAASSALIPFATNRSATSSFPCSIPSTLPSIRPSSLPSIRPSSLPSRRPRP